MASVLKHGLLNSEEECCLSAVLNACDISVLSKMKKIHGRPKSCTYFSVTNYNFTLRQRARARGRVIG